MERHYWHSCEPWGRPEGWGICCFLYQWLSFFLFHTSEGTTPLRHSEGAHSRGTAAEQNPAKNVRSKSRSYSGNINPSLCTPSKMLTRISDSCSHKTWTCCSSYYICTALILSLVHKAVSSWILVPERGASLNLSTCPASWDGRGHLFQIRQQKQIKKRNNLVPFHNSPISW